MQDWEPYSGRSTFSGDDPWDLTLPKHHRRRIGRYRPESHTPEADHVIGSCDTDISYSSSADSAAPSHGGRTRRTAAIILILALLIMVFFLALNLTGRSEQVAALADGQEDYAGDDGFSVNVDPDEDEDYEAEEDDTSSDPSDIELYTGDTSAFSLTLCSREGLEELSYQENYATVIPSVVSITVNNDDSGACSTGIILSEDGFILTNQHVVAGESYALVTTWDDVTYDALLVGEDANSDLAVLKIDAEGLTPARFGDSDELAVGDECFAIGNPLGVTYRGSFSNGIISALNRSVSLNDYTMRLIQTTAALNSGNSGGPLIDIYGQVIGINNMKVISSETTVEGLGFAIPSATAQRVVNALLSAGAVEHPVIGITCYAVTAGDIYGSEIDGVFVATVNAASDALQQGLSVGDIITAFNGEDIRAVSDIDLSDMAVGDLVTVTVYRNGEYLDITFALVEQNDLD